MDYGFVYCIGNECMPGVYKVGMTDRAPSKRCEELSSSTSVPMPFDLLFFIECLDPRRVEACMHKNLSDYRISENREFFQCDLRAINDLFLVYRDDGCAYADTSAGETELALLDYHNPRPVEINEDRQDPPVVKPMSFFLSGDAIDSSGDKHEPLSAPDEEF